MDFVKEVLDLLDETLAIITDSDLESVEDLLGEQDGGRIREIEVERDRLVARYRRYGPAGS